jgi:NADH-quinone oxidoreductase subunit H
MVGAVSFLGWVPSWIWFFGKVMLSIFVFIWMRGTLPRLRQDQLMNFAWKFVLPLHAAESAGRRAVALHGRRLAALGGLLGDSAAAYVVMGRWACAAEHFGPRSYRYAE